MTYPAPLDPERIVSTFAAHEVSYVLVGAVAARLHGMPRMTADMDISPQSSGENLERLATALRDLGARVHTESIPEGLVFDCSGQTLGRAAIWNLTTQAGRVDLIFDPPGTDGYDDLRGDAVEMEAFGTRFFVASLSALIRMKQAADRPQDRQDVLVLREIQSRLQP